MKISSLDLTDIGPFDRATLEFQESKPAVTFITGENGTGKSVIVDGVRLAFGNPFVHSRRVRDVYRSGDARLKLVAATGVWSVAGRSRRGGDLTVHFAAGRVVLDFWNGRLFEGPFRVQQFKQPGEPANYNEGALQESGKNADTTNLLCYLDYLRDSRDTDERTSGELAWSLAERIVAQVVPGGRLLPVKRATFEPRVEQHGRSMPLELLSTGSLYALSHLLRLLLRMHQCNLAHPGDGPLHEIPGILLIDEPETHLHPKWQKRFLPDLLDVFPNLQIIAATHSPFIVSSVRGAKVYRCQAVGNGAIVEEVQRDFGSQTIDETLASPAFSGTNPYPEHIAKLVDERREAKLAGDREREQAIEKELVALNPDEFAGFRVRELLTGLGEAS